MYSNFYDHKAHSKRWKVVYSICPAQPTDAYFKEVVLHNRFSTTLIFFWVGGGGYLLEDGGTIGIGAKKNVVLKLFEN